MRRGGGARRKEGHLKPLARQPRTRRRRRSPICDRVRRLRGWVDRWRRGEAPDGASEFLAQKYTRRTECNGKKLAVKREWGETRHREHSVDYSAVHAVNAAAAGAVMCALWRIRKVGKSANHRIR